MKSCQICKKIFKDLKHHLIFHKISTKEYYNKYLKKEDEGKCFLCNAETGFLSINKGYRTFCSKRCSNYHSWHNSKSEKRKEETSKRIKTLWASDEYRTTMSEIMTKFNKKRWKEDKEYRLKMKEMKIKHWQNKDFRKKQTAINQNTANNPANKEKLSKRMKEMWKNNIEYKNKLINEVLPRNYIKTINSGPNKCEQKLWNILNEIYPNEFEFTGGGTKPVLFKWPDFINERRKIIVEYNSIYFHRNETKEDVKKRIDLFESAGYKTLIISEEELKNDKEKIIQKIIEFTQCAS